MPRSGLLVLSSVLREPAACKRWIRRKILPDTQQDGLRHLVLVFIVLQLFFFLGIRQKGRLNQNGRNVRRLEYGETGLLDMRPVQVVHSAELAKHSPGEFQAVVDGRLLREVHQYLLDNGFVGVQIDAAYLVSLVFLFRQDPGGGRRRATLRQREYRRSTRMGADEGIRVDRNEQVRTDFFRLH